MKRLCLLPFLVVLAACSGKMIPDTQIEDTPDNRSIADLVERYRIAVEQRDIPTLRELISRRYFTNAGTTATGEDDYGFEQVEIKLLPMLHENVKSVQLTIYLRKIEVTEVRATAEYEFYYKFFYVDGGKDRWMAKNDFARLDFSKEDGNWRIVNGL